MAKVTILADSTCDLSPELLERYEIKILPLYVVLDEKAYRDGVDITPARIYEWSDVNKTTPKTSAFSVGDAEAFIREHVRPGEEAVFICISGHFSASAGNALTAAQGFDDRNVHVVDSLNLSTGIGLSVVQAAQWAQEGYSAQRIVDALNDYIPRVRASFVVDSPTYLYRGGRCSAVQAFCATALRIKPQISVVDGHMRPTHKFRGSLHVALRKYCEALEPLMRRADAQRVFITHTDCPEDVLEEVREYLMNLHHFQEVLCTDAGGVISSHCGPGTLGVLFTVASAFDEE